MCVDAGLPRFCPSCRWFGKEDNLELAVFDLMGPSLSDLFYSCGKQFSLKTVLMLADQMIERLGYIHQCGLIHGDVKPGNFVIGNKNCDRTIYVIDFGLSSYWCDQKGEHIPYRNDCAFKGTYRYASINSHFKIEQSRRDDLESLGYVLIYFLKGKLPWQNLKMNKNERRKIIGKHKEKVTLEELTENLPTEFYQYMGYIRKLEFSERPDYIWLRSLFRNCMWRHRLNYDFIYDWNHPKQLYIPNFSNLNSSINLPLQVNGSNNYNATENKESPKVISISTTDNNNEEFKQYYPMEYYTDKLPPIISPSSSSMTVLSPCTTLSYPYTDEDIQNTIRNNNLLTICEPNVYVTNSPSTVMPSVYQIQNYSLEPYIQYSDRRKKRKNEDNDYELSSNRTNKYPRKCYFHYMYNNIDN